MDELVPMSPCDAVDGSLRRHRNVTTLVVATTRKARQRYWQGEREVMQHRSNRGSGKPVWVTAHQARACDWDPIQRIALGPAAMYAASTGRTHDCTRPACTYLKLALANREPSTHGRVGMWRGGIRIGLSVSASFVWRCLNSRANCSVSTPLSSNRTCRFPASGSRTKPHAFTHGRSCPSRVRRTSPKCPYRCERGYAPPLRRLTLCLARNHRRNRTAV